MRVSIQSRSGCVSPSSGVSISPIGRRPVKKGVNVRLRDAAASGGDDIRRRLGMHRVEQFEQVDVAYADAALVEVASGP